MTFAIVETGGKQYRVAPGDELKIEKITPNDQGEVVFDKVLLVNDGQTTKIGQPYIAGATVSVQVTKQGRHPKITVIRYKAKVRYRKVKGHRQPFSQIKVANIN